MGEDRESGGSGGGREEWDGGGVVGSGRGRDEWEGVGEERESGGRARERQ